jgi:hypothetical protein
VTKKPWNGARRGHTVFSIADPLYVRFGQKEPREGWGAFYKEQSKRMKFYNHGHKKPVTLAPVKWINEN